MNAYQQCMKVTHVMGFDTDKALAWHKHLHINIRSESPQEYDMTDTFFMGAPRMHHLLGIPMKAQSIQHLEDIAKGYTEWMNSKPRSHLEAEGPVSSHYKSSMPHI